MKVAWLGSAAMLALACFGPAASAADKGPDQSDALERGFETPPDDPAAGPRIMTSPGFSHTGDAQVQPQEAMKKLVWSTVRVTGGNAYAGRLPAPPDNSGPFQNFPYTNESPWTTAVDQAFYRDVTVLAYRAPQAETAIAPTVLSSAGPVDATQLAGGDPAHPFALASPAGTAWIQFDYATPQTIRTAVLATPEIRIDGAMYADLEALGPNGRYRRVARLDMRNTAHVTVSFAPARTTRFRLVFARRPLAFEPIVPPGGPDVKVSGHAIDFFKKMRAQLTAFPIARLALLPDGRINEFERKAGFFTFVTDYYALATPAEAANRLVRKADVIDLSGRLRPDGSLDWTPPPGQWDVVRLGYSLTGAVSHPEQPGVSGLEVDKFDPRLMRTYLTRQLDRALASPQGKGATWLFADSIEAGPQNWTDDMLGQFQKRRGYDPRPFLPALTGVVVESPAATDKFLWDYRQTLAELLETATYKTIADMGHERGLKVSMEALETGRYSIGDDLEMRRYADEPVGALWFSAPLADYLRDYPNEVADQRGAASLAHFYGRPIAGAESGTDLEHPGMTSPRSLKPLVDLEFAFGVSSVPPTRSGPGEPWAPYADDWNRYLARTSFMLQQGRPVSDVAYYYGEEGPLVVMRGRIADTPRYNGFDFINTEALQSAEVEDGRLVAPSGLTYRVLQLGGSSRMQTVPVLRRLKALVSAGLTVVGHAPDDTPSLSDNPAEFRRLRAELWGADGKGRRLGKGRVQASQSVDQALAALGTGPDLTAQGARVGVDVLFQHRALSNGELYFVVSRSDKGGPAKLSFRQTSKAPELWRADSRERTPLSYRIVNGRTIVPIDFRPNDAVFVLFRDPAKAPQRNVPRLRAEVIATLDGDWRVSFAGGRGAPPTTTSLKPGSWTASSDPAIRYFSGVATYTRTVDVPASALTGGGKVLLALGEVRELADVSVNGEQIGVRFTPPYSFDVTSVLKPGANQIEIRVANLAANRMIGASQAGVGSGGGFGLVEYRPDAAPRPSGVIGPVTLVRER